MARRSKSTDPGVWIFTILIFLVLVALKWIFIGIVAIIGVIVAIVKAIVHRNKVKNITDKSFKSTSISPKTQELEEKSVVDELDLFNKSIYKNDFEPQIMRRGEVYYSEDRIKYFKQNENKYTCKVKGTETYDVSITFDENDTDKIKEATCTCPYFTDKEKYCKHIYSVLYKIKCGDNKEKIINEYYQHIESINKMITNATNYIERNSSHFTNSLKEDFVDYGKNTVDRLNSMKESFDKMLYEDNMISMLKQIVNMSAYTKDKIKGYLDQENTSTTTSAPTSTTSSSIKLSDVIAGMLLSDAIDNHIHKDNKKIIDGKTYIGDSAYSEEELEDYGLFENEKEEVRKGNYDPWNFEEEDLEEDDYYYEDD